jgi:hypothetical protein
MSPWPPRRSSAVPRDWNVRAEIIKAIRRLSVQEDEQRVRRRQADLAALRRDFEGLAQALREAFRESASPVSRELRKTGYNPDEPRVPAGNSDGGEWTREGGGASSPGRLGVALSEASPENIAEPDRQYAANEPPAGIGHNQGPPLEDSPKIPPEEPEDEHLIWDFVKAAIRWLARALPRFGLSVGVRVGLSAALAATIGGPIGEFLLAVEVVKWLNSFRPVIYSYFDPPKTWEELQQNSGPGYDRHHIVERWSERDGMPRAKIYASDNVVPIPKARHWEINSWLSKPNAEFKDANEQPISPREYMKGKSWEERYRFGLDVLIRFKVLKP